MIDSTDDKGLRKWGMFALLASAVTVADQLSKWWAIEHLTHAFASTTELGFAEKLQRFLWTEHPTRAGAVAVLDNFWHFRYVENPGAAWGFLASASSALRTPFFICVSLLAMGFIGLWFKRCTPEQRLLRTTLGLVFGGAIGNFVDRIRLGYVIDFIDWHWYDRAAWPTFNVADSAITVGVVMLLLDMLLQKPEPSSQRVT